MGKTKLVFLDTFIENVSSVAFFIESKGLPQTAIKYKDQVFDYVKDLNYEMTTFPYCKDPDRSKQGLKCIPYRKKYTLVFYQFEDEVVFTEFTPSKLIY